MAYCFQIPYRHQCLGCRNEKEFLRILEITNHLKNTANILGLPSSQWIQTLPTSAKGAGLIPRRVFKIPQASGSTNQNTKQK